MEYLRSFDPVWEKQQLNLKSLIKVKNEFHKLEDVKLFYCHHNISRYWFDLFLFLQLMQKTQHVVIHNHNIT